MGSEGSLPQTTTTGLLERGDEIAAVDAAIDAAKNGAGRFVVIEGPPGIGKTSILVEGRTRAVASGLNVLQARGSELETAFSFGVVRQLFEAPLARRSTDERNAVLGGAAAQAARLFTDGTDGEPAQDDPFSLLHGLYWLTANLSDTQPLLLAIDDIQWSDGPSLRWLAYLSRRLEGMPVVVVASLRPINVEQPQLDELLLDTPRRDPVGRRHNRALDRLAGHMAQPVLRFGDTLAGVDRHLCSNDRGNLGVDVSADSAGHHVGRFGADQVEAHRGKVLEAVA